MKKNLADKFDFNYFSEETSQITINKNKSKIHDLISYYKTWDEFMELICASCKSDDPFFILNAETTANIEGAIIMSINGYYRQGFTLMRCWFENSLYSIYFQDHTVEFAKWSVGELTHKQLLLLTIGELTNYLFQFSNFSRFNEKYKENHNKNIPCFGFPSFKGWMDWIYHELSAHVHGRGYYRSSLATVSIKKGKRNFYNRKYFDFFVNLFSNVLQILLISYLLYKPNLLNRFREKRKEILEILRDEFVKILIDDFNIKY